MEFRKGFLSILFISLLASCGNPSNDDVRNDFLKEHPKAKIISIYPGEGDGGAVYMHINYQLPPSEVIHKEIWQYIDNNQSQWTLSNKEYVNN